ncbi:MAG: hypothetical protein EA374_08535 [Acholeplasmatales bacterium]|nr:MAG: hypothetical protein EA374_08535 [Acholeplasmatales bacterium]
MRKYLNTLISNYKAVLELKKRAKQDVNITLTSVYKEVLFLLVVIVLFMMIFRLFENFHFVLLSSNVFVVGSFLLYRVKEELMFKEINRLEYATFSGVFNDLLHLVMGLSLFSYFIALFFSDFVAFLLLIVYGIMFLIASIMAAVLKSRLKVHTLSRYNEGFTTLWIIVLFFGIFYTLGLPNMIVNYSVSFLITVVLILFKFMIPTKLNTLNRHVVMAFALLSSLVSIVGVLDQNSTLGSYKEKVLNRSDQTYVLETNGPVHYTLTQSGLLIEHLDFVQLLNHQLNPVISLDKNEDERFYMIEGVLYKTVLSADQSDVVDNMYPFNACYDVFRYSGEHAHFEFVSTVIYEPSPSSYPRNRFFWLHDSLHYYSAAYQHIF